MKKRTTATIVDVEKALAELKDAVKGDPAIEVKAGKKLAAAADLIQPKDDVTKLLNQAYGYGENWWAKNVVNGGKEGCTTENKLEKIKGHILDSDAYRRLIRDDKLKPRVERWLAEDFIERLRGEAGEEPAAA